MRVIVRSVSELCITVGTLIVLFVVYVLFWTGVKADHTMSDQIHQLQSQWSRQTVHPKASPAPAPAASPAPAKPAAYKDGKPFAIMYIPRLGFTWNKPVLEDTDVSTLKKGLGHYAGTARWGRSGTSRWRGTGGRMATPSWTFPSCGWATRWC